MLITLDSKRRLTIPKALAPISPGDHFDANFDPQEDTIIFRRLSKKEDWFTVMKECPVRIDDASPRRHEFAKRTGYERVRHRRNMPASEAPSESFSS